MKLPCYLVRDLLPLYKDELCEPETAADLRAHLDSCPDCRALWEKMQTDAPLEREAVKAREREQADALRRVRKNQRKKRMLTVLAAVAATLCAAYFAAAKLAPAVKALKSSPDQPFDGAVTCQCGTAYCARPNAFLLFFFPAENKRDYGVENLKPWVDPEKKEKGKGKKGKLSSKDGASDIDDTASDTTDTAGTKTDNDDTANGR